MILRADARTATGRNSGRHDPGEPEVPSLLETSGSTVATTRHREQHPHRLPREGNPPWSAALSDKDIRSMVILFASTVLFTADSQGRECCRLVHAAEQLHEFQLSTWKRRSSSPIPWPSSPATARIAPREGHVYLIENGRRADEPLKARRPSTTGGQDGCSMSCRTPTTAQRLALFRVQRAAEKCSRTGQPHNHPWTDQSRCVVEQEKVFQGPSKCIKSWRRALRRPEVFVGKGHLFFTIGSAAKWKKSRISASSWARFIGSSTTAAAADNRSRRDEKAFRSIWSYGHRFPQGRAECRHGDLYDVEHGPRGATRSTVCRPQLCWPVIHMAELSRPAYR